jgi:DNA primase large subunit
MFTKEDFVKYPFIDEAIKYVKDLGIEIDELENIEYAEIISRAKNRIKEGLENAEIKPERMQDEVDLFSYSVALVIVTLVDNERVKNRYALAESKRAQKILRNESDFDKVIDIAENTFKWNLRKTNGLNNNQCSYGLSFNDYLKNSVSMIDSRWKLVNRDLYHGYVSISRQEICRLLQEEVRIRILENLKKKRVGITSLQPTVDEIKKIAGNLQSTTYKKFKAEEMNIDAFPPCIKSLNETLRSGGNLSHMGRFTLTSFLINIGLDENKVLKIFEEVMDFDEKKALYQIEHIAGTKGGRIKYKPPKCDTLKTHGLCINSDEICKGIKHPISYYDLKLNQLTSNKERNKKSQDAHANQ